MNKLEFQRRLDEVETLIADGKYAEAVQECDLLNLDLLDQPRILQTIAKAYEKCRRYADAEDLLLMAREIAPKSRGILFHLCSVSIKAGELQEAHRYYDEFTKRARYDSQRFVLQYRIARAENQPEEELIRILQAYRREEPDDRWMFELARLQAKNGMLEESAQTCEDIELWFGNGRYVNMARELLRQLSGNDREEIPPVTGDTEDIADITEEIAGSAEMPEEPQKVPEDAPAEEVQPEPQPAAERISDSPYEQQGAPRVRETPIHSERRINPVTEAILQQETREIPTMNIARESEEIPPIDYDFSGISDIIDEVQAERLQAADRQEENTASVPEVEYVPEDVQRDIEEYGDTVVMNAVSEPAEAEEEKPADPRMVAALQALQEREEQSADPESWTKVDFAEAEEEVEEAAEEAGAETVDASVEVAVEETVETAAEETVDAAVEETVGAAAEENVEADVEETGESAVEETAETPVEVAEEKLEETVEIAEDNAEEAVGAATEEAAEAADVAAEVAVEETVKTASELLEEAGAEEAAEVAETVETVAEEAVEAAVEDNAETAVDETVETPAAEAAQEVAEAAAEAAEVAFERAEASETTEASEAVKLVEKAVEKTAEEAEESAEAPAEEIVPKIAEAVEAAAAVEEGKVVIEEAADAVEEAEEAVSETAEDAALSIDQAETAEDAETPDESSFSIPDAVEPAFSDEPLFDFPEDIPEELSEVPDFELPEDLDIEGEKEPAFELPEDALSDEAEGIGELLDEHVLISVTEERRQVNPDTGMLPITEEEDNRDIANPIFIDFPDEMRPPEQEEVPKETAAEEAPGEAGEASAENPEEQLFIPPEDVSAEEEQTLPPVQDPHVTFEDDNPDAPKEKSFEENAKAQLEALINELDEPIEEQDDVSFIVSEIARRKQEEQNFGNLPIDPEINEKVWHFVVYGETNTLTLDCAREHMKEISEEIPNSPSRMLKINSDRIGNANIVNSMDRFLGNMVVVEQAASLSDQQLRDFAKILDKDDRSLLVVFTDTKDDLIEMFRRVPELADSFSAVFEGRTYSARDLVNAAKEYLYSQGAKFSREADAVVYEKARELLGEKKGFYKSEIREYAEKALSQAEKGGFLGLSGGKVDKDGYLVVTEKHLRKANRT